MNMHVYIYIYMERLTLQNTRARKAREHSPPTCIDCTPVASAPRFVRCAGGAWVWVWVWVSLLHKPFEVMWAGCVARARQFGTGGSGICEPKKKEGEAGKKVKVKWSIFQKTKKKNTNLKVPVRIASRCVNASK